MSSNGSKGFENAKIIDDEDRNQIEVHFTYEAMPFVMNAVKASNCIILEQDFEEKPRLKLSIPISELSLIPALEKIDGVKQLQTSGGVRREDFDA